MPAMLRAAPQGSAERRASGDGHVRAERAEAQPDAVPHAAQPAEHPATAATGGRRRHATPDDRCSEPQRRGAWGPSVKYATRAWLVAGEPPLMVALRE
jgi:hypothetical protein